MVSTQNIKEGQKVPVKEPAGKNADKFGGQAVVGPGDEGLRTVGIPRMVLMRKTSQRG